MLFVYVNVIKTGVKTLFFLNIVLVLRVVQADSLSQKQSLWKKSVKEWHKRLGAM